MPRGAKLDREVTKNLREAGILENPASFVSLDGHLFLEGRDKSRVRSLVFVKHKRKCVICGHHLFEYAEQFTQDCGAWHHPKNCDCVGCSELRCDTTTGRKCHAHGMVGFKREATKDFAKLYPEGRDEHSGNG